MCDCISEMNKKLQDYTGDPEASIVSELSFVKKDDKMTAIVYPCVYGKFREKKKDGTLENRATKIPVIISHCPFCGKAYK